MSIVTLAYQAKVQRNAFLGAVPQGLHVARESRLMSAAMVLLALGCVALSLLAVTGLEQPLLVGVASDALLAGRFEY